MSKNIISLLKGSLLIIILLFISTIIINTIYFFDIINNNTIKYLKLFLSIFSFFIGGVYIGKQSISKGYINGLKLSLIIIILLFIMSLIFKNFKVTRLIYFFITIISITFGSMVGINNIKNNSN